MKTYTVTAKRWARGWELHIDGVGVTQAANLKEAEEMARDYIEAIEDVPADGFAVEIHPDIEPGLAAAARGAKEAIQKAEQAQQVAASRSREAVRSLKDAGLSGVDVAAYLGVSPQRVSQLAPDSKRSVQASRFAAKSGAKTKGRSAKRSVSSR